MRLISQSVNNTQLTSKCARKKKENNFNDIVFLNGPISHIFLSIRKAKNKNIKILFPLVYKLTKEFLLFRTRIANYANTFSVKLLLFC